MLYDDKVSLIIFSKCATFCVQQPLKYALNTWKLSKMQLWFAGGRSISHRNVEQSSYKEFLISSNLTTSHYNCTREISRRWLGDIKINDFQHLENQLEISCKHSRSTRAHIMLDQLSDLKSKAKLILEPNKAFEGKLKELLLWNFWKRRYV